MDVLRSWTLESEVRILQVTLTYYPELQQGGPPAKIHALSRGLATRGHQVEVVTLGLGSFRRGGHSEFEGVHVRFLPWIGWGIRRLPIDLRSLVEAVRAADVVHCYRLYDVLCPAAAALAALTATPYLLEPMGMYVPRARRVWMKRVYHRLITKRIGDRAAKIIAASPAEATELAQLCPASRLVVRRNGVDAPAFEMLPPESLFRLRHGLSPQEKVILFIGRISPIKNLEQLVVAFQEASLEECRLVLAGPMLERDYARKLRRHIQQLGLSDRVLLIGPVFGDEKLSALAAAELFVLPSLFESFGNSAAEAVAARIPVLVSEACGIAPLIDRRAGLAVPLETKALSRGMRTLLLDPHARDTLTRRRADVLASLSWEAPLDQTEALYREVVAAHP